MTCVCDAASRSKISARVGMIPLLETNGKHQACPDGNHRRGMRATVSSPCREPKQLGGFKHAAGLLQWSGNGAWITGSRVDGCDVFVQTNTPFDQKVDAALERWSSGL